MARRKIIKHKHRKLWALSEATVYVFAVPVLFLAWLGKIIVKSIIDLIKGPDQDKLAVIGGTILIILTCGVFIFEVLSIWYFGLGLLIFAIFGIAAALIAIEGGC